MTNVHAVMVWSEWPGRHRVLHERGEPARAIGHKYQLLLDV